jgi:aspartyl-tRNA(Asn)/glutamyl-tRNA(Gln) amidotransferase subunit A
VLGAIAGYDKFDLASVEAPVAAASTDVRQLRIGIPRAPFFDNLDSEVGRLVEDAIAVIEGLTSGALEVALPATSHISLAGETYAFHQPMFDRAPGRYMLHSRTAIQADAKARTSDYIRSRWELELLRRTIDDAFDTFDIAVLPTRRRLPLNVTDAFALEQSDAPRNPELENTGPFNIYGIPAISVPCGFTSNGLPVGLTIAGPRFSEERVLAVAQAYETATGWTRYLPPSRF